MISFAFVDGDGIPTGGGRRPAMPEGAVALPPPLALEDLPRLRWRDGRWEQRDGLVAPPLFTAEEAAAFAAEQLARARASTADRINAAVGRVRLRIYTDIPGQDALYLEKRAEALTYVAEAQAAGEPETLADFPLLENETGVTAQTAWQLAQLWLNRNAQFKRVGAATERARMRALIALEGAMDEAAIEAVERDFTEALTGLSI